MGAALAAARRRTSVFRVAVVLRERAERVEERRGRGASETTTHCEKSLLEEDAPAVERLEGS